ncbi:MAG TPA: DUF4383 domain-containing protein [Allosphingosinicella sp.]|jgi:hypothetical protein|nr:DUF4383 domain-containing protein [Allosphingosinicella sp.]
MSTRTFALIFGIVFLVIGLGGFVPGLTVMDHAGHPADAEVTMRSFFGYELGLFPVNLLHNIVHILFGLWGLAAARSLGGAITYARAVAIIYALLTVLGLLEATRTTFGLIPIYGNDVWLHALLAIVGAYFGWVHRNVGVADRT